MARSFRTTDRLTRTSVVIAALLCTLAASAQDAPDLTIGAEQFPDDDAVILRWEQHWEIDGFGKVHRREHKWVKLLDSRAFGRFTLVGVDPMFVNPGAFDGALTPAQVLNNYNEDFDIESATSRKGYIEVLGKEIPVARNAATLLVDSLASVFNQYNTISLEDLKKMGKRPARQALERIDSILWGI